MDEYEGPPTGKPAPISWHPPLIAQPPPPRSLPAQDHEEIDRRERAARNVTFAVAAAAFLMLLVVLCSYALRR